MTSSARRDTSTPIIAATKANSATKSRDGGAVDRVASTGASKPSSARDGRRVQPERRPGERTRAVGRDGGPRRSQSRQRSTSRSSGQAWASRWWASRTGWACCRCVRPGIGAHRVASAWSTSASTRSRTRAGQVPGLLAQVHPEQRGDLVVARAPGPQRDRPGPGPARSISPRSSAPCTSSSSGRRRSSRGDVGVERVDRREHPVELAVVEQAGAVQHPRVGPRPRQVVAGQPPVEVRRAGQRFQRVGRAAREAAAPQRARRSCRPCQSVPNSIAALSSAASSSPVTAGCR